MMADILIGIDAGTSVMKSVAFDLGGRQLAVAAIPNSYQRKGRRAVVQDHGPHLGRCRQNACRSRR
jgi:erythritol kinase